MAEVQVKTLSVRHDAIMDYMLANPVEQLGTVAQNFGVSAAWLSVIIHSDAFQRQLADKKDVLFGAAVVSVREKLNGVAAYALDKLAQSLEHASPASDKDFIASTTDSVLKNLGYGPKSVPGFAPGNVEQQNIFVVSKESLASAREKMREASVPEGTLIEQTIEGASSEGV